MILTAGNKKYWERKNLSEYYFVDRNPTKTGQRLNPGVSRERQATNRLVSRLKVAYIIYTYIDPVRTAQ